MYRRVVCAVAALMIVFVASRGLALYSITNEGIWPASWPAELEPLRKQSRTLTHTVAGHIYEIPFTSREQFESVWPQILKVKTPEAPIVLLSGPNRNFGQPVKAGVRILAPQTGTLITPEGQLYPPGADATIHDRKFLAIGPPWPDDVQSKAGALPKYVIYQDGKWAAYTDNKTEDFIFRGVRRARIEIELIVDGDVVDLNRIALPADTPIIDKRFESNKAEAADKAEAEDKVPAGKPMEDQKPH